MNVHSALRGLSIAAACAAVAAVGTARLAGQDAPRIYAITGARITTVSGPVIENGTVIVANGRILSVGASVAVPPGAEVIDGAGLEVTPGFFDAMSQVGLTEISAVNATNDITEVGAFNPQIDAATAVHPSTDHIPVARVNGVTHVVAAPGVPGNGAGGPVIGGQASAFHLDGWTIEEMLIDRSVGMVVNWPSLRSRSFDPSTFSLRTRPFREAKEEQAKQTRELARLAVVARGKAADRIERNLKLEALAEKKVPVILGPTQALPNSDDDPYDATMAAPAVLHKAGVTIAMSTYSSSDVRNLPYEIGTAVGFGLPHDVAVRAITLTPAQLLGLDRLVGSIEPGKIANLIVSRGDPLEIRSAITHVFIKGVPVPLDSRHTQLYEKYKNRPKPAGATAATR